MYACSINSHRDSTEQIAVIILFMNEETKGQIKKNCIASYIAEDKTEFGKKLAIPFVVLLWFYPQKKKKHSLQKPGVVFLALFHGKRILSKVLETKLGFIFNPILQGCAISSTQNCFCVGLEIWFASVITVILIPL